MNLLPRNLYPKSLAPTRFHLNCQADFKAATCILWLRYALLLDYSLQCYYRLVWGSTRDCHPGHVCNTAQFGINISFITQYLFDISTITACL